MNTTTIHVGELVKNYINNHRIFKSALDRSIQKPQNTTVRYQKQESLQSSVLMALCHALKHNFFADIATLLPQEYTTNAPINSDQTNKIAELEQEIIMLNREKNLLLEALKKG